MKTLKLVFAILLGMVTAYAGGEYVRAASVHTRAYSDLPALQATQEVLLNLPRYPSPSTDPDFELTYDIASPGYDTGNGVPIGTSGPGAVINLLNQSFGASFQQPPFPMQLNFMFSGIDGSGNILVSGINGRGQEVTDVLQLSPSAMTDTTLNAYSVVTSFKNMTLAVSGDERLSIFPTNHIGLSKRITRDQGMNARKYMDIRHCDIYKLTVSYETTDAGYDVARAASPNGVPSTYSNTVQPFTKLCPPAIGGKYSVVYLPGPLGLYAVDQAASRDYTIYYADRANLP